MGLKAFNIAIACLDGKIADRKGYEYLRKLGFGTASGTSGPEQGAGHNVMANDESVSMNRL